MSPYLVPSNTEPEPEDVKVEKQEAKDEPMKEEVKDESGGAHEPSAPPRETTTMDVSSEVPAPSVATLPSGVPMPVPGTPLAPQA
eukprot:10085024-Karenia_brevis.AAC.1